MHRFIASGRLTVQKNTLNRQTQNRCDSLTQGRRQCKPTRARTLFLNTVAGHRIQVPQERSHQLRVGLGKSRHCPLYFNVGRQSADKIAHRPETALVPRRSNVQIHGIIHEHGNQDQNREYIAVPMEQENGNPSGYSHDMQHRMPHEKRRRRSPSCLGKTRLLSIQGPWRCCRRQLGGRRLLKGHYRFQRPSRCCRCNYGGRLS